MPLKRLAQRFQGITRKLGQLIKKQHAMMGKRNFSGPQGLTTTNEGAG